MTRKEQVLALLTQKAIARGMSTNDAFDKALEAFEDLEEKERDDVITTFGVNSKGELFITVSEETLKKMKE